MPELSPGPELPPPAIVILSRNPHVTVRLNSDTVLRNLRLTNSQNNTVIDIDSSRIKDNHDESYEITLDSAMAPGLYSPVYELETRGQISTRTQTRALWVLDKAPESITFAYLSDTHTGDPRAGLSSAAVNPDERRRLVYEAACAAGVDFMIVTGDIVSVPTEYKKEYRQAVREFTGDVTVPLFLVPGNHDMYATSASGKNTDGMYYWHSFFGPYYYSVSIGSYTLVITDSFDWPRQARNFMNQTLMQQAGSYDGGGMGAEQFGWLKTTLDEQSGRTVLVFGHHLFRDYAEPNGSVPDMVSPDEVLNLLAAQGVKNYFAGHNHRNFMEEKNGVTQRTVVSASSDIPDGASWGFDKCTAVADAVTCEFVPVVQKDN